MEMIGSAQLELTDIREASVRFLDVALRAEPSEAP
jgi:hypothetical protein